MSLRVKDFSGWTLFRHLSTIPLSPRKAQQPAGGYSIPTGNYFTGQTDSAPRNGLTGEKMAQGDFGVKR
jgi:hypothetical protein